MPKLSHSQPRIPLRIAILRVLLVVIVAETVVLGVDYLSEKYLGASGQFYGNLALLGFLLFCLWRVEVGFIFCAPVVAWIYYSTGFWLFLSRCWLLEREGILGAKRRHWSLHQTSLPFLRYGPRFDERVLFSTLFSDLLRLAKELERGSPAEIETIQLPMYMFRKDHFRGMGGTIIKRRDHLWVLRFFSNEIRARARYFGKADSRILSHDGEVDCLLMTREELISAIPFLQEKAHRHGSKYRPLD